MRKAAAEIGDSGDWGTGRVKGRGPGEERKGVDMPPLRYLAENVRSLGFDVWELFTLRKFLVLRFGRGTLSVSPPGFWRTLRCLASEEPLRGTVMINSNLLAFSLLLLLRIVCQELDRCVHEAGP